MYSSNRLIPIQSEKQLIDAKKIALDMRYRLRVDPIILLILHALSGCDTMSFIRNITKKKILSTYFNNPSRYPNLIKFVSIPPPRAAIDDAEQLLIDCYESRFSVESLDELRAKSKLLKFFNLDNKTYLYKY